MSAHSLRKRFTTVRQRYHSLPRPVYARIDKRDRSGLFPVNGIFTDHRGDDEATVFTDHGAGLGEMMVEAPSTVASLPPKDTDRQDPGRHQSCASARAPPGCGCDGTRLISAILT